MEKGKGKGKGTRHCDAGRSHGRVRAVVTYSDRDCRRGREGGSTEMVRMLQMSNAQDSTAALCSISYYITLHNSAAQHTPASRSWWRWSSLFC